jgi:hypothetical protein
MMETRLVEVGNREVRKPSLAPEAGSPQEAGDADVRRRATEERRVERETTVTVAEVPVVVPPLARIGVGSAWVIGSCQTVGHASILMETPNSPA